MENDLMHIPIEELLCNPKFYASEFTCNDLLSALTSCTNEDKARKEAIKKILTLQHYMFWSVSDSDFTLDSVLNKFFSNSYPFSIKDSLIREGVKNEDLESRFKMRLLKACTLVIENNKLSDEVRSFFDELCIDINNIYFLNKLKNDLILEFGYFYDVESNKFAVFPEIDKLEFWRWKIRFDELIQKRLNKSERFIWKNVLSWCSAFWDTVNYRFFWDDVVLYEEWDDYVPIDSFCTIELNNSNSVAGNIGEDLADVDLEEMYDNWDRFIVVKSTYKEKFYIDDMPLYGWFVDVYSIKTKRIYRVLSW